jgi:hypothetical protein
VNDGIATTTGDDPYDIIAAVVDLLMFSECWYQGEISRSKLFPL